MANSELKNLYNSISSDIGLTMYSKEDEISFHSRLIYSAIGIWMLTAFKDKNAKEDDNISKSHVTIVTSDVLNSFLALDPIQRAYFSDPNRFISLVKAFSAGTGVFMVEGLQLIVAVLLMILGVTIVITSGKELIKKKAAN